MIAPNDGVAFPVAESLFGVHNGRTLVNALAVFNLPAPVITAVAFAPLLLAAQMARQVAALRLVGVDVLIDALVTDGRLLFQRESPGDLFGTPLLAHQNFDSRPRLGLDTRFDALLLAVLRGLIGLLGAVAALPPIAAHFARDSRGVDADVVGDLLVRVRFFQQGGNLVSLLAG